MTNRQVGDATAAPRAPGVPPGFDDTLGCRLRLAPDLSACTLRKPKRIGSFSTRISQSESPAWITRAASALG